MIIKSYPHYVMTQEELEAAIYNWLDQSGSHVTDSFIGLEPFNIECMGGEVYIDFKGEITK